jgi:tRNA threonylcarbamoyl adenosine modification protein (Sua5/YciO/YrdC/YwlC family)
MSAHVLTHGHSAVVVASSRAVPRARTNRPTAPTRRPKAPARDVTTSAKRGKGGKGGGGGGGAGGTAVAGDTLHVTLEADGSDDWRLDDVADAIRAGGVGIIPTDSRYAFVVDLESRDGVQTLYDLKGAGNSKPMSILCRGFSDIDRYTQGFPDNVVAGRQQPFKLARKCLPGPYTFILNAGKDLPKVCLVDPRSKAKNCKVRKTVGVRVPNHPVTQALLARLDRPLLCGTVPNLDETYEDDNQDPVLMLDEYERKGLAFLVDVGVMHNPASTVIDLSSGSPKLIRRGAGDASMWVDEDEDPTLASDDEAWGF